MSTGGCNLVEMKRIVTCYRRKTGIKNAAPRNKCSPGNGCFLAPKRQRLGTSPLRFLRNLRDTALTALCMVSLRKKPSTKISSLVRSMPSSDSHRSESVEACIKYINSSSTSSSSSSSHSESNPNTAVPKSG